MADEDVKWGPNPYPRPYAPTAPALPKRKRQLPATPDVTENAEDRRPVSTKLAEAYRGRRS